MKVDAIKDIHQIKLLRSTLYPNARNLLLFEIAVQSGLRMGDILKLRIDDFNNKKVGDTIRLQEQKTKKQNIIVINKTIHKAFKYFLKSYSHLKNVDFLFSSRKGNKQLHVSSVNAMIKRWCADIGLSGNYGCHSLRKTFGYIQRVIFGVSVEVLSHRYNHSSIRTTQLYLGIDEDEVRDVLLNDI